MPVFFVLRFLLKKIKEVDMDSRPEDVIPLGGGFVFLLPLFCFIIFSQLKPNIETIIKIKLAPRVYILEYVTNK
jgi:hypothetical protein